MHAAIGVVGGGTVGRAVARTYVERHEVLVHDGVPERSTCSLERACSADVVFLCVPEGALEGLVAALPRSGAEYAVRSTTPVGTVRRLASERPQLRLVHSPEFLTARHACTDALLPARNIVGVPPGGAAPRLLELYRWRFPGVPLLLMSSDESEAVKLASNALFACKVSFFNELRTFCDAAGLGWASVLQGILTDGRVSHSHTDVPGPDGERGFGGACLPKDLDAYARCLEAAGVMPYMACAAKLRNRRERGCE